MPRSLVAGCLVAVTLAAVAGGWRWGVALAARRAAGGGSPPRVEVARNGAAEGQAPTELDREALARRLEARHEATAARCEGRLRAERHDLAWREQIIGQLRAALPATPTTRLVEAACGHTICRVVLEHGSEDDQRQAGPLLATMPPFDAGAIYRRQPGSRPPRTTVYLVRAGQPLGDL